MCFFWFLFSVFSWFCFLFLVVFWVQLLLISRYIGGWWTCAVGLQGVLVAPCFIYAQTTMHFQRDALD